MKTKIIKMILISLTVMFVFTACGEKKAKNTLTDINQATATEGNSAIITEPVNEEQPTPTEEIIEPDAEKKVFKNGTWFLSEGEKSLGYFSLYTDSTEGIFYRFADNTRVEIVYSINNNKASIDMGSVKYEGELEQIDEETFTLKISEEVTWKLDFISDKSAEEFSFYTSDELCEMALDYYEAASGYRPGNVAFIDNPDTTISLHLFDDMPDYVVTSAWYTVDRITATGVEDMLGDEVALANGKAPEAYKK